MASKVWESITFYFSEYFAPAVMLFLILGLITMCASIDDANIRQERRDFKSSCIAKHGSIQESESGKLSCLYK